MKVRHFIPLAGFFFPTVIIGYGVVIPNSPISGINRLTIGFAATVISACVTYVLGLQAALREHRQVGAAPEGREVE